MIPAALIPTPDTIPVPWGWFEILKLATFACHLLLMNVVFGGAILALIRGTRHDTGPQLAGRLPTTLALTVNLGVPPLLFLQVLYGQFLYTAAVLSAVYWMALVGLVMAAYALLYVHAGRIKKQSTNALTALALPLAVLALLGTSFILTNIMTLKLRPEVWPEYFQNAAGTILNLSDPTLLPRWLHFVFSAVAVGGLFSAILAHKAAKAGDSAARARMQSGLAWFTHVTVAQIGIGFWWLVTLPREIMLLFMGGQTLHTAVLVLALVGVGGCLAFGFMKRLWATTAALVVTVCLMIGLRDLVRMAYLEPYFHPSDLEVTAQYGPMYFFLISFVIGIGAIAYMFKLHRQDGGGI